MEKPLLEEAWIVLFSQHQDRLAEQQQRHWGQERALDRIRAYDHHDIALRRPANPHERWLPLSSRIAPLRKAIAAAATLEPVHVFVQRSCLPSKTVARAL